MLILLPPSEGKTAPQRGRPVDLDQLSHSELAPARRTVLDALATTSAQPDATTLLGVGASLQAEVVANTALVKAPAAPAAKVYSGVLYEAAGLAALTGTARRRANSAVRIVSALWGVLTPADRIPAYRLPMGGRLTGLGPLARWWRPRLAQVLEGEGDGEGSDVVLDCRSSVYAAAWAPRSGRPWLTVRVVAERGGVRTVVSHHAKHTRGLFTHHLLVRPNPLPRTIAGVLDAARELTSSTVLEASVQQAPPGKPDVLELVVRG